MRVVIIITPGGPGRDKQKGRRRPERTAAVDRVRMKENVIAACGPRPVLDAHAVFPATRGGCSGIRVVERRGHGKPHAASLMRHQPGSGRPAGGARRKGTATAARSSGWADRNAPV